MSSTRFGIVSRIERKYLRSARLNLRNHTFSRREMSHPDMPAARHNTSVALDAVTLPRP